MLGAVESLNVSVASGVCLYEALRQRMKMMVELDGLKGRQFERPGPF
jgi:hypothetical protein